MMYKFLKIDYTKFIEDILVLMFFISLIQFGQDTFILSSILTLFLLVLYYNKKNRHYLSKKWVYIYFWSLFVLFILEYFRSSLSFSFISYNYGVVFLILLVFPLYEVICTNKWDFFNKLNKVGLFVFFMKTIAWLAFNFFNIDLGFGILGGRVNWTRTIAGHSFTRMNGTFLDGFLFSYALFKYLITNNREEKKKFLFEIIFLLTFTIFIYQSRVQLIYYLISMLIGCFYFYSKKENATLNVLFFLMVLLILGFIFRKVIFSFWNSFLPNTGIYAGSTNARVQEYTYFSFLWKKTNILLGFGFLDDSIPILFNNSRLYLSDVGILMQLYQFGILGFVIDIIPLVAGFIYFVKTWYKLFTKYDLFLMIFTVYIILSSSSFNPYLNILFLIFPIYISALLYRTSIYFNYDYEHDE